MATHPPASAVEAAHKAAAKSGGVQYNRGRPHRLFDWSSVTAEAREAAVADYYRKKRSK